MKLIQIERKDLAQFRKRQHIKQIMVCPLLNQAVSHDKTAVDHKHKRKKDPIGIDGDGLIRGVVQIQANALEGKIINNFKRLGLAKFIDLPSFLRNLANYLENPPIEQIYIHPSEKPKVKKLMKRSYNKLATLHKENNAFAGCSGSGFGFMAPKLPEFPKSGKLTKPLEKLYAIFNLEPEFYMKG